MHGFPPPEDKLVTLANLQDAPYNRWSFLHISNVMPTAQISRGSGPVTKLPRMRREVGNVTFTNTTGETTTVTELLEQTYTDGFLVLKDGAIVAETYFNGMEPHTRHLLMSVSKSITGMLVGIFVEKGVVDLDAHISTYVPELEHSAYGDASVQQLLDMTASVEFNEDYADPRSEIQRQDRATGWRVPLEVDVIGNYNFIKELKKAGEHGQVFQYCSANTDVLGWVLERTTGVPFAELLGLEIWSKLGAEHDAYVTVDRYGTPLPNGGICVTLRDLARFGQMVLQDGHFNGQEIVPARWICQTRHHAENGPWLQTCRWAETFPNGSYHNQWWLTGDEHQSFYGSGIHGQQLWIDPTTNVVIVKLSTMPAALDDTATANVLAGMSSLACALA
jgi:CubicO group peptidase (beta-lactamase class C family)